MGFDVEQMQKYNVEKTLMMLTLLGSHGVGVYEKFIKALTESNFNHVVKELRRTEKTIKFGKFLFQYYECMPQIIRFSSLRQHHWLNPTVDQ
jgi:uncharacterized protein (UPF0128 family)